jgi:hypothetical protein
MIIQNYFRFYFDGYKVMQATRKSDNDNVAFVLQKSANASLAPFSRRPWLF